MDVDLCLLSVAISNSQRNLITLQSRDTESVQRRELNKVPLLRLY
jgi:hypothetical protein